MISITDIRGLMVLVLQDGTIRQEVIPLTKPATQAELSRAAQRLNALLQGLTAGDMTPGPAEGEERVTLSELEREVLSRILSTMVAVDRVASTEIHRDGLINVLSQPEFAESERFCRIVEALERRSLLESIIEEMLSASGVQVIIGGESRWREMEDLSLVLSRYGINGEASGVLGVMGPTRMRYGRAISAVRYVARLLTGLVEEVYGY
jgi:heat-inducible transcriptional repressor